MTDPERVLALGDSYTIGTGVDADERWVTTLVERRRAAGHAVADPTIVAENGWTTGDLDAAIDRRELRERADLVTLLVGANNCFQSQPPAAFRPKFDALLDRACSFADGPQSVLVLTIPDYTRTPVGQANEPDAHRERLRAYNEHVRERAGEVGTRLVDVLAPSERVADEPELVAGDDLHPAPAQHDLWLERIYPEAAAALDA